MARVRASNDLHKSPSQAQDSLDHSLQRVDELAHLEPDWSPRGSKALTPRAIGTARQNLLLEARGQAADGRDFVPPYYISPIVNGGISLSWRGPSSQLWTFVAPDGDVRYYWEDLRDPDVFDEQAAVSLDDVALQIEKTVRPTRERA